MPKVFSCNEHNIEAKSDNPYTKKTGIITHVYPPLSTSFQRTKHEKHKIAAPPPRSCAGIVNIPGKPNRRRTCFISWTDHRVSMRKRRPSVRVLNILLNAAIFVIYPSRRGRIHRSTNATSTSEEEVIGQQEGYRQAEIQNSNKAGENFPSSGSKWP